MPKEKPLYTYATRRPSKTFYQIVHNPIGIPVFESVEAAESDFSMLSSTNAHLEHIVIDIGSLVEARIIPKERLFGKAVREGS